VLRGQFVQRLQLIGLLLMTSSLILALLLPAMGVQHIELLGSVPPEATGPVEAPRVNVWVLLLMCGIGGFGLWTVAALQAEPPPASGGTGRGSGSSRRRGGGRSPRRWGFNLLPPWLGRRRRRRLRG
jgi:hypothetical protein